MAWLYLNSSQCSDERAGFAQTKAGDKEWNAVVEAAKKEGKVVVAGSPDPVMRNDVIPKFTARYGIPVEFIAGRSSQIAARVETERGVGYLQRRCFSRRARHHGQRRSTATR